MSDSDRSNEIDSIDKRTLNKIKAAEQRQMQNTNNNNNNNRRSSRKRKSTPMSGVNLDDFGRVAFKVARESDLSTDAAAKLSSSRELPNIHESEVEIPTTVKSAKRSVWWKHWKQAMDDEYESIRSHNTFIPVM